MSSEVAEIVKTAPLNRAHALESVEISRIGRQLEKIRECSCRGRTIFLVAHRLATVRDADTILMLKDGHCVECGSYSDLMTRRGAFYQMEKMQG